jgi:hypothetical protein
LSAGTRIPETVVSIHIRTAGGEVRVARGKQAKSSGPELGYEAQLWKMADALRNNMDAAEYKHVVLGLIFLKYISDAFEAKHDLGLPVHSSLRWRF